MVVEVSLYIPCYNSEKYIDRCIQSVLNQTYPIKEILIIDDGSTDKTVKIASKYPVKIIRHLKNKGLAAARNTAFNMLNSEFIASLDSDCCPQKDWLEKLIRNFVSDKIAGVGGRLIEKNTKSLPDKWRSKHLSQDHGDKKIFNAFALPGCNCVFRKQVIIEIGGYNEKYKTNSEDTDICLRLKNNGYSLVYEPQAKVFHLRKDTVFSVARMYYGWGKYILPELNFSFTLIKRIYWQIIRGIRHIWSDVKYYRFDIIIISIMCLFLSLWFDIVSLFKNEKI
ncbi:MAG: glycosyltransferase [Candidatus Omnitrophica bacterium]|nr:glycosyltransferase [Candidatus Omnitrophota bacterium]